jgi:hypothetical protein
MITGSGNMLPVVRSLAICLEGVNMVVATFRYGLYKPAYAHESG